MALYMNSDNAIFFDKFGISAYSKKKNSKNVKKLVYTKYKHILNNL